MTESQPNQKDMPDMPGAPQTTFSGAENKDTSISNGTTGATTPTTNTNTNGVYVYNVYKEENKLEALVHSRVPLEIKVWLKSLASQFQESESTIIRKLLSAAYQCTSTPQSFQAPTIILNYNVAKAESKPVVNVGEYVALRQLDELIQSARKVKERAERESQEGKLLTFTVERAKKLEEELLKAMRNLKRLPPEKLQEVEAALSILKGIREGKP